MGVSAILCQHRADEGRPNDKWHSLEGEPAQTGEGVRCDGLETVRIHLGLLKCSIPKGILPITYIVAPHDF